MNSEDVVKFCWSVDYIFEGETHVFNPCYPDILIEIMFIIKEGAALVWSNTTWTVKTCKQIRMKQEAFGSL